MKIKASDLVAKFIAEKKVNHIFAISGGASLHLIHSIADQPSLQYICCHHEQSCAMAADAYARVSKNIGVAIATSGPGATNLITGICGCYYDSIPLLAITGQVSTFRMKGNTGVRQIGFQETPIVDICKPIVKYAVQITDKNNIIYELEKAYQNRDAYHGPAVCSKKYLIGLLQTNNPHLISKSLCNIALQDPNFKSFNHRNAWSKKQLKNILSKHGFKYIEKSKSEMDAMYSNVIPDWHSNGDWSMYALFAK